MRLPEMDDPVDRLNLGMYLEALKLADDPRSLDWGMRMNWRPARSSGSATTPWTSASRWGSCSPASSVSSPTPRTRWTRSTVDDAGNRASSSWRTRSRSPTRSGTTSSARVRGHRRRRRPPALERFRAEAPALVILDLMLPEMSGLDVCRAIRAESDVPIIMVTAKDSEADKVTGLELGADDYVTKPFSVRELVSRVRAHLRRTRDACRCAPRRGPHGRAGRDGRRPPRGRVGGEAVAFPPKEFELLETFLRRKGRLLTRDFLIEEVWGPDYFGDTKTLDVHVKRLRQKIEEDPHEPAHLLTVRGLGYKFVD